MSLWGYELKKILFVQKGLLILTVCLALKILFLFFFPEMKDTRIQLSQKQYDKYLERLYGANTQEKDSFIRQEYENCKMMIGQKETMEEAYRDGSLTETEWQEYVLALDEAYLHQNAVEIFYEKAEQFAEQSPETARAHYIYEYGWQTVFSLQLFPDIFVLFGILLLAAQCFSAEAAGGMLPLLLAAKDGRRPFFLAKLSALSVTALAVALLGGALEAAIFVLRGWCGDSGAPVYSISLFKDISLLELSLGQGYLLSLGVRTCVTFLFAGMVLGISVWIKNTTNLLFAAVCVLCIPLLLSGTIGAGILFTHIGLLCGSRMLLQMGDSGIPWGVFAGIVAAYSGIIIWLAEKRHCKGL